MSVNSFESYQLSWKPRMRPRAGAPRGTYLEVAAELEEDILSGRLKPGTKLPPQRELADYLDLNFTTITRAYDACRAKGLIYGVVGRGTFVASEPTSDVKRQIIDLGVVEAFPEIGADEIVAAAKRVLARGDAGRLFDYSARDGRARPMEAALKWLKTFKIGARAENVAIFPGTQSALSVALLSLFQPGDKIAVDTFTYANLKELAYLAHLRLVAIKGDKDGMLSASLLEAAEKERLKGVYLMPTAANPTGRTMSDKRRAEITEVCEMKDLIILEDSAAVWKRDRHRKSLYSLAPTRTLHLAGGTRYLASGLRVAFVAFPERFKAKLLKGLHHLVIKASALEAEILAELILSGSCERILEEKRRKIEESNRLFDEEFGAGAHGFFRTVPLAGTAGKGADIERELLAEGIKVCHSDRFQVGKGESFLRVSVSSEKELSRLQRGLKTLKQRTLRQFAPRP